MLFALKTFSAVALCAASTIAAAPEAWPRAKEEMSMHAVRRGRGFEPHLSKKLVTPRARSSWLGLGLSLAVTAWGVAHAAANPCDPLTYGAVADGVTDNTVAIQTAVDNCHAIGGGTVPFDHGVFLTGPFQLKDDIMLRVAAGATILGTTDQTRYSAAYIGASYASGEALISTNNASDVGIIGGGTIDGQGDVAPPSLAQSWFGAGLSWYGLASTSPFNTTPYARHPNAASRTGQPRPGLVA